MTRSQSPLVAEPGSGAHASDAVASAGPFRATRPFQYEAAQGAAGWTAEPLRKRSFSGSNGCGSGFSARCEFRVRAVHGVYVIAFLSTDIHSDSFGCGRLLPWSESDDGLDAVSWCGRPGKLSLHS